MSFFSFLVDIFYIAIILFHSMYIDRSFLFLFKFIFVQVKNSKSNPNLNFFLDLIFPMQVSLWNEKSFSK